MKLIAYNVREDERKYIEKWAKRNKIEVAMTEARITAETAFLAKGYDGICALQTSAYEAEMFQSIAQLGIHSFAIRSVGYDSVDIEAAKKNNVKVTNVPGYSPSAIAEFSVSQALQLIRRVPAFNQRMEEQDFRWSGLISKELKHMTVGVIGTGRIGQSAIDIYQGFGSKILAYDVYQNPDLKDRVTYVEEIAELFQQSDLITLHAPALESNFHMINEAAIKQMKQGVYLVNTARGSLVDTDALLSGLNSGKVAGAALDTYENETAYFSHDWRGKTIEDTRLQELLDRSDVLLTPHIAFYTEKAVENMVDISLDSVKELVEIGKSRNEIY
ncbi:D-2-hydroxyacid dehydrogenase [Carnobacterium divergens]|uniref:D-2-hydroxyacid dehydrogenase n=1 Tax=Carnobacterium divergens TaxID=2748 RepID=A0AAW8R9X1_CARDV|nr:D-2-hydroxyacid dehydrogenase [Carnobacterium divergens]MDT1957053.1 D-2-hydroxyacid dehydrogenase [Carnobacterium divergens]MDT1973023.1 D-2-hydroxyacid dehydrogenase [Carnobacterium divergens]